MPASRVIEIIHAPAKDREEPLLVLDGQVYHELNSRDTVRVNQAKRPLKILSPSTGSYFNALHTKLLWGGP